MENGTVNGTVTDQGHGNTIKQALYIFSWIMDLVVLSSNVFILVVLLKSQALRKQRYIVLVMSLAFGDLLIALGSFSWLVAQVVQHGRIFLCYVMTSLFIMGVFISVYLTFIICLNRYLTAISSHYANRLYAGKRKVWLMSVPSACAACFTIGLSFGWERNISSCDVETITKDNITILASFFTVIIVPLMLATIILFILSFRAIIKRFGQTHIGPRVVFVLPTNANVGNVPEARKKTKITALKTLGIILFFLLIGTAPFVFSIALMSFGIPVRQEWRIILTWFLIINSTANPIVYTWRFQELRQEMKRIICCCFN